MEIELTRGEGNMENIMLAVKLKSGETVQAELDNLRAFLDKNREVIEFQHKYNMGKRRTNAFTPTSSK